MNRYSARMISWLLLMGFVGPGRVGGASRDQGKLDIKDLPVPATPSVIEQPDAPLDPGEDPDRDGLTNAREKSLGTNPENRDTDADGLTDGEEVNATRTNPLDASDGLKLLEEARGKIMTHWRLIYPEPLVFTNKPGSPQDLEDLQKAMEQLSGKFIRVE
jgi:hypothetical protein